MAQHRAERRRGGLWLGAGALVLLGFGLVVVLSSIGGSPPPPAPLPAKSFSLSEPEVLGPSTRAIRLAPDSIAIPSLHVSAPLVPAALTASELSLPGDDRVVGLYTGGAQPGAWSGTLLLASHVNTISQGPGVLYSLVKISPGAEIDVTTSTGVLTRWSVTALEVEPKDQLDQGIFSSQGPARLVLVTCGGPFDSATGHYTDNVVVTALPA